MHEVRIGDRVKVGHGDEYSEVFFFSHRHLNAVTSCVRIDTSIAGISLTLSPGHLIYVDDKLLPASSVKVGDTISISHGDATSAMVTNLRHQTMKGLHNPHTLHGDIIVNRIRTSGYTSALHPSIAYIALAPFRIIYQIFGTHPAVESLNRVVLGGLDSTVWQWS